MYLITGVEGLPKYSYLFHLNHTHFETSIEGYLPHYLYPTSGRYYTLSDQCSKVNSMGTHHLRLVPNVNKETTPTTT
jgi:hypothetical protein